MQTITSINNIIFKCNLRIFSHNFNVGVTKKGDGFLIQLSTKMQDTKSFDSLKRVEQKGAKYFISHHAIDSEVVGAIWKAFQDFVIHEAREGFLYKSRLIYGPHWDVESLHRMASTSKEVSRNAD